MAEIEVKPFKWTVKRQRYCYHYARNGGKGGKAAKDAGYAHPAEESSRLLTYAEIVEEIDNQLRQLLEKEGVTDEYIISKWKRWADHTPKDLIECDEIGEWSFTNPDNWPDDVWDCIKKISINNTQHGQNITVEWIDKKAAADNLAKVIGLLNTESGAPPPDEAARLIRETLAMMDAADGMPPDAKAH